MARRPDSEAIGRGPCITPGCDQTMLVFRTKRRGHHLMGRCPDCKSIQGTGKAVQDSLRAIVDGATPPEAPAQAAPEPSPPPTKPAKPTNTQPDYDPGETVTTTDTTTGKEPDKGGLFVLALAIVGGVFALSLKGS